MVVFDSLANPAVSAQLQQGRVGVLLTDTIYGIVASAQDRAAVARLYQTKHREGKPGTVVAADTGQLESLGLASDDVRRVAYLWPDPVSIVLPASDSLAYLHQGTKSLAVRVPSDQSLHDLLVQTGPLLTSSANYPGELPATTVQEAQAYFGDSVDFYVDGGSSAGRVPSTIAQLTSQGDIRVLRQGAVSIG